jgi:hypothetical protein
MVHFTCICNVFLFFSSTKRQKKKTKWWSHGTFTQHFDQWRPLLRVRVCVWCPNSTVTDIVSPLQLLNESSRVYGHHDIFNMEILVSHSYQNTSHKVTKAEWMKLFLHKVTPLQRRITKTLSSEYKANTRCYEWQIWWKMCREWSSENCLNDRFPF